MEGPDFAKLYIIKDDSNILYLWKPLETMVCLLSSYYYGWLIAFGDIEMGIPLISIIFEGLMFFGMMINFLREYTPDGET